MPAEVKYDLIRDKLRDMARRRGLMPVDIAAALEGNPTAKHVADWFGGKGTMVSVKVSRVAKLLGLTITPEEIVK